MPEDLVSIPDSLIENSILLVRGHKVILDRELARLYGVSTRTLNQAVKQNVNRFPGDFMFQLTFDETAAWRQTTEAILRSQNVILKQPHDAKFKVVFDAIRTLLTVPDKKTRKIGFRGKT